MASIRRLKKDIDYVADMVIQDCFLYMEFHDEKTQLAAWEIIIELDNRRCDFIQKANHPDGKNNPKLVKKHYKGLILDFIDTINKSYTKLNELVKTVD
ncbi:hypothetical protein K5X82_11445 [Halosquirtibacter xylanolyticus]|uniref:hypothetical protein n=1 Tax=Halosquirtibacter xylanolyticus TaxID=3374599 RepID=UPI00374A8EB5|nr:hypothetical protein K5X82_11445 [Prolixibacteraceae bacterium]